MSGAFEPPAASADPAEEQYVGAKTSVWWDIENCHVPRVCEPFAIAQNINSALSKMNYRGPVSISAYGDTNRIPAAVQQALSSTGIALNHVPAGVKDASDKKILVDMLFWAVDNPAPANYLLISGDRDFSNALHQLSMRRYNILLAQPKQASAALVSAAKSVWLWTSLLAGGGPMSKSESTQIVINGDKSTQEASPVQVSGPSSVYQPPFSQSDSYAVGNQKFMSPSKGGGAGDLKFKGKNVSKNLNQPSMSKTQSLPMMSQESSNGEYNPLMEYAQGRMYSKTPHDVSGPPAHFMPSGWTAPNNLQRIVDPNTNNFKGMQENQYPYPARPRGFTTPGHMYRSNAPNPVFNPVPFRPDRPSFPPATSFTAPDIGKQNMSAYPNYAQQRPMNQLHKAQNSHMNAPPHPNISNRNPLESSSVRGSGGSLPPPSEHDLELIGLVLHALDGLKNDKIFPGEANIADCICFGNLKYRNTDVKKALDVAIKRQMVMRQTLGDLQLYVVKGQKLWNCVNPIGGNPNQYNKATWLEIQKFITSPDGRSAMSTSSCKYEAALILKRSCLRDLPLGDVLRILNMLAGPKKWIKHNPSGWQPVTVTAAGVSEQDVSKETIKTPRKVFSRVKATSKEVVKKESKEVNIETVDETSSEASKEASEEVSSEASKEASEEASSEASKEASEEASSEASKEASEEASSEASKEASLEAIKEASTEVTKESVIVNDEASSEENQEASWEAFNKAINEFNSDAIKEASAEATKESTRLPADLVSHPLDGSETKSVVVNTGDKVVAGSGEASLVEVPRTDGLPVVLDEALDSSTGTFPPWGGLTVAKLVKALTFKKPNTCKEASKEEIKELSEEKSTVVNKVIIEASQEEIKKECQEASIEATS